MSPSNAVLPVNLNNDLDQEADASASLTHCDDNGIPPIDVLISNRLLREEGWQPEEYLVRLWNQENFIPKKDCIDSAKYIYLRLCHCSKKAPLSSKRWMRCECRHKCQCVSEQIFGDSRCTCFIFVYTKTRSDRDNLVLVKTRLSLLCKSITDTAVRLLKRALEHFPERFLKLDSGFHQMNFESAVILEVRCCLGFAGFYEAKLDKIPNVPALLDEQALDSIVFEGQEVPPKKWRRQLTDNYRKSYSGWVRMPAGKKRRFVSVDDSSLAFVRPLCPLHYSQPVGSSTCVIYAAANILVDIAKNKLLDSHGLMLVAQNLVQNAKKLEDSHLSDEDLINKGIAPLAHEWGWMLEKLSLAQKCCIQSLSQQNPETYYLMCPKSKVNVSRHAFGVCLNIGIFDPAEDYVLRPTVSNWDMLCGGVGNYIGCHWVYEFVNLKMKFGSNLQFYDPPTQNPFVTSGFESQTELFLKAFASAALRCGLYRIARLLDEEAKLGKITRQLGLANKDLKTWLFKVVKSIFSKSRSVQIRCWELTHPSLEQLPQEETVFGLAILDTIAMPTLVMSFCRDAILSLGSHTL